MLGGEASIPRAALAPVNHPCYLRDRSRHVPPHSNVPAHGGPRPLRPDLSSQGGLRPPISLSATILWFFLSPSHLSTPRGTTSLPRRQPTLFLLSVPPHLLRKVLSFHNLVPGIGSEGAGLLSNLSGPTLSYHAHSMIGGGQHLPPSWGGAAEGAAGRKSAGGNQAKSRSKKGSIRRGKAGRPGAGRPRARARARAGKTSLGYPPGAGPARGGTSRRRARERTNE